MKLCFLVVSADQVNAETVANQVELMRKVSNLNILSDSNKLLRDERDQLLNTKQELESKVRQNVQVFKKKLFLHLV